MDLDFYHNPSAPLTHAELEEFIRVEVPQILSEEPIQLDNEHNHIGRTEERIAPVHRNPPIRQSGETRNA